MTFQGDLRLIKDVIANATLVFELKNPTSAVYWVPEEIRGLNPSAYSPKVISIGPLHRHQPHLQAMERHKEGFMIRLISRAFPTIKLLDITELISSADPLETMAKHILSDRFYDFPKGFIDLEDLTNVLFVNGCFMLEFIYGFVYELEELKSIYPVLYPPFVVQNIINDLLLLENQIPLEVLTVLFNITLGRIQQNVPSVDILLLMFLNKTSVFKGELTKTREVKDSPHMLDFLQKCLQPMDMDREDVKNFRIAEQYGVAEVHMAGVKFEPFSPGELKLKVEIMSNTSVIPWGSHCCLRIPKLEFQHGTDKILSNLVAIELCSPNHVPLVSSYVILMDALIQSNDDVKRLQTAKILISDRIPSTEVLQIFKSLSKNALILDIFCYCEEWKQLHKYCNTSWPWLIILQNRVWMHLYRVLTHLFRTTTWKTLGVIGALILFVLTLLQTIFTILK